MTSRGGSHRTASGLTQAIGRLLRRAIVSPIRVLCFFHETTWSGAPIQLLHLLAWLRARGWHISAAVPNVTTQESGPITDTLRQHGVEVFPILDLSRPPDFAELRALCRRVDLVLANTLVMWAAVRAAHAETVATIWYIHEGLVGQQLMAQIPEIQPTLAVADIIVVPTRRTAQMYAASTQHVIEVLPYGIPPATRVSHTAPGDTLTFLTLGSFEPRKGQDVLLKAISQLPATLRERGRFRLAGRRLAPDFYEQLARAAIAFPNVELLDALGHDEARAAVAATDVLVSASRDETGPLVVLEAMSYAKAVVGTEVGGVAECLRDGVHALLVPPEDPTALAHAIGRCLSEPQLVAALGAYAHAIFLERFSIDRLGRSFVDVIRRALRARR